MPAPAVTTRLMSEKPSERETEVLSNREIARSLHISEATVKTHLIHDFRTTAVATALERGIFRLRT